MRRGTPHEFGTYRCDPIIQYPRGRFFGHDCYYAWALGPVWAPVKFDDYYFLSFLILNMLFHRGDVD